MSFVDKLGSFLAMYDVGRDQILGRVQGIISLVLMVAIYLGGSEKVGLIELAFYGLILFASVSVLSFVYDRLGFFRAGIGFNMRRQTQVPPWAEKKFKELTEKIDSLR